MSCNSGGSSCQNDCGAQQCPASFDASSLELWRVKDYGKIPGNSWFIMFMPNPADSGCSWIPYRVKHSEYKTQLSSNCFGDIKANGLTSSDCSSCDDTCWVLANGRQVKYYNESGDMVESFTLPDYRGKTLVMPDPTDYFGHGITAPGMAVGEAKHLQIASEVGPLDIDADIHVDFTMPLAMDGDDGNDQVTYDGNGNGTHNQTFSTDNTGKLAINASVDIQNANANTAAMNNMQPSIGANFYMYICKEGLEATVSESSLPANPVPTGYANSGKPNNNDKPWWLP